MNIHYLFIIFISFIFFLRIILTFTNYLNKPFILFSVVIFLYNNIFRILILNISIFYFFLNTFKLSFAKKLLQFLLISHAFYSLPFVFVFVFGFCVLFPLPLVKKKKLKQKNAHCNICAIIRYIECDIVTLKQKKEAKKYI